MAFTDRQWCESLALSSWRLHWSWRRRPSDLATSDAVQPAVCYGSNCTAARPTPCAGKRAVSRACECRRWVDPWESWASAGSRWRRTLRQSLNLADCNSTTDLANCLFTEQTPVNFCSIICVQWLCVYPQSSLKRLLSNKRYVMLRTPRHFLQKISGIEMRMCCRRVVSRLLVKQKN